MQETGDETQFQVRSMKVSGHGCICGCYTSRVVAVWPFHFTSVEGFKSWLCKASIAAHPQFPEKIISRYSIAIDYFVVFMDFPSHRSEVKARQDVKPDFRHPPFTDYRQPPVDYRHPPVTDYRQPPTLDYRQPPGLLDFRQHPAAAQFPLGIPADFRPQVPIPVFSRHHGCTSLRALGFL